MDLFGLHINNGWFEICIAFFSSALTYLATKATAKKDLEISEREQLSKDQYKLIEELREMIKDQKIEIDELKNEIKQLQKVNVELVVENNKLRFQIAELNEKLESLRK